MMIPRRESGKTLINEATQVLNQRERESIFISQPNKRRTMTAKTIIAGIGIVCGLLGLIWPNVQLVGAGVIFASAAHFVP